MEKEAFPSWLRLKTESCTDCTSWIFPSLDQVFSDTSSS